MFSVLDWPAGSVPVTFVREEEESYDCRYDDKITKLCQKTMKGSRGLPVSIQIASLIHREETVLRLMKEFEGLIPPVEYPWGVGEERTTEEIS